MPRGRRPQGDHALSDAERQARYRARRQPEQPSPRIRYRRAVDRRTRPQRWRDAVAELLALQAEYATWCDALPDTEVGQFAALQREQIRVISVACRDIGRDFC